MPANSFFFYHRWKTFTSILAIIAAVTALLGLSGWIFDNNFLRCFLSDGASMKVNTSVLIILAAIVLWLLNKGQAKVARVPIYLVLAFSTALVIENLFLFNFHIDELLLKDPFTNPAIEAPGRTSLLTAVDALIIGAALYALSYHFYRTAQLLAVCVFLIVYISLMGHLFHISGFYHLGHYSGVAFHTGLALLCLATGLLTVELRKGFTALVVNLLSSQHLLIYFLSYFFAAAPMFAAAYFFIIQHGSLSPASDIVILFSLTIFLSLPIAYFMLRLLSSLRADLLKAGQRLDIALNAGKLGSYDLDIASGIMKVSAQCKMNFGLPIDAALNMPELFTAIIPEHRKLVQEKIKFAVDNHQLYEAEYQITWPDGTLHWIRAAGKPDYDKNNEAVSITGVTYEITQQKNYEQEMANANEELACTNEELAATNEELQSSNEELLASKDELLEINTRYNIALDAGSFGSTELDLVTGTMKYNEQFLRLFGRENNEHFIYTQMFEAMLPHYREKIRQLVAIAQKNHSVYAGEYEVVWPDGSIHWISAHGKAKYNSEGVPVKMIGILSEITESKKDDQRKNDFIGMVSHELKTPLTSLTAIVQMANVKLKNHPDQFIASAMDKANLQVKRMSNMINGFLNISRLESGKIQIVKQEFKLNELISDVVKEQALSITTHIIHINKCDNIKVSADRDKIHSVISNLLSNAIKYSPKGKNIFVECKVEDEYIKVTFKDEGIGIQAKDIDKLFERYYRVETGNTQHISGFGIGLYLSSEIVERHNGKIGVDSEFGHGSTFWFTLPLNNVS